MKIYVFLGLCLFSSLLFAQVGEPIIIGEKQQIRSEVLDETREVNIYLPTGYDPSDTTKYAVIYLLDGGLNQDFVHVSGIVQFLSFSWINKLPPSIIVGIENVDRKRDFTFPTSIRIDKEDFPTSGGSEEFIQFIAEELQPFIAGKYKTSGERTIIGQSLGGLLATEILFSRADLFDHYIIVSPSLWWDKQSLLRKTLPTDIEQKSVYVAVGKEGEIMGNDARALHKKLSKLKNVYFQFLSAHNHGDALHLAVYDAFEKIFTKKREE